MKTLVTWFKLKDVERFELVENSWASAATDKPSHGKFYTISVSEKRGRLYKLRLTCDDTNKDEVVDEARHMFSTFDNDNSFVEVEDW